MKRFPFAALVFSIFCLYCGAGDLVVAEKNAKSDYRIVVPDSTGNKAMDRFLLTAAEVLHKRIVAASGVRLPVVKESAMPAGKPGIYIGNTAALRKAGFSTEGLKRWEHRIAVKGKEVFLYGNDVKCLPNASWPNSPSSFVLGSVRAAAVFAEKFVNTRFLVPGEEGAATLPLQRIVLPENYSFARIPAVEYCVSRSSDMMYDLANNAFYAPWYGTYGGHSHNVAIPQDKYFKTNPEYFALIKGKRTMHPTRPQYCLSNPKVRELIYQELLDHADKGYEMVQLGQSDGFRPCECAECANLYGVKDFGEKLWIMHREMAERFLKDRPGKKLCIMAYGPTLEPPQTFKDFPDNVMIELAPFSKEILTEWKKCRVPGGFTVYLYNWGWYQSEGFTPKQTMKFLAKQAAAFHKGNVRGIYRCGFGELYGLEGPAYYQWSRQLDDPSLDSGKLLDEYCRYAFGSAADTMKEFYLLIDQCLQKSIPIAVVGEFGGRRKGTIWNDPALLEGNSPAMLDNMRLLALRYPPERIAELEALLAKAEKSNPETRTAKFLLPIVRLEFDYLKRTAGVVTAFERFRKTKSDGDFKTLAAAVDARNQMIAKIPIQPRTNPPRPEIRKGLKLFGYPEVRVIQDGGRLQAPLFAPFNWDVKWMLEKNIKPAGRVIPASGEPQLLVQKDFYDQKPAIKEEPVSIRCAWDAENLYVTFLFGNTTQTAVRNDAIQVILGNGKRRMWFTARARNGQSGVYERTIASLDNKGNGDRYKIIRNGGTVTAPAPGADGPSAMIAIPWNLFGEKPEKGARWDFNAIRDTPRGQYIWEYNLFQKTWRNLRDAAGTIQFD